MGTFTIGFASDHAGFALKEKLAEYVMGLGYSVKDFGCYTPERCDYPDYAHPLAEAVAGGVCRFGIAVCYTANGMSMSLNRHHGVRAAICWQPELAGLARKHNDANVCSLAAKYTDEALAYSIVDAFLSNSFEGGRHTPRLAKIECVPTPEIL
ncbi:MAG: ribose 5-phosphate isomerase B [Rikenellaceae bacterium]|jgi:ribose 5-phosphate isomerase B|nr:ribose 5-phosphate isomerase B [Rikenellaceae bacterium]